MSKNTETRVMITTDTARKHLTNLAAILNRKGTTGRNDVARTQAIENHLSRLHQYFSTAEETDETGRMYDRYVALERRWLGL